MVWKRISGTGPFTRTSHGVTSDRLGELLLDGRSQVLARLTRRLPGLGVRPPHPHAYAALDLTRIAVAPVVRHRVGEIIEAMLAVPRGRADAREECGCPLDSGSLSAAGTSDSPSARRCGDLDYEPTAMPAWWCWLPPTTLWRRAARSPLFELAGERFLAECHRRARVAERLEKVFAKAGFRPRYSQEAIDHDEDLTALVAGRGVMLSSRFFRDTLPAEVRLLELTPAPRLPFELVHRRESRSPALARFVQVARAVTRRG